MRVFFLLKLHTFLLWEKVELKIKKLKVFEAVFPPFYVLQFVLSCIQMNKFALSLLLPTFFFAAAGFHLKKRDSNLAS